MLFIAQVVLYFLPFFHYTNLTFPQGLAQVFMGRPQERDKSDGPIHTYSYFSSAQCGAFSQRDASPTHL
jgi:hypothetical protein